jgi:hypothetical protein
LKSCAGSTSFQSKYGCCGDGDRRKAFYHAFVYASALPLEVHMKIAAFCLCWVLIGATPGVMAQQTAAPHQSWDVLRQLQAGEKIRVERKTVKKKLSGNFVSLSDVELAIERKGKAESISRDEVKNIWRVKPPSVKKRAIFTSIGGGAGVFLGLISAVGIAFSENGSEAEIYAALIGIPVGCALVGYAMAGSGKRILIYSAP